jgi:hypothetical protein
MFQCTDIRIMWDYTVTSVCWPISTLQALSYTNAALNILTDFCFAVLIPVPMLWRINVNARSRYTLLCILGLGIFACAAALIKVIYLIDYGKLGDWLWDSRNITIWTVVENNIGILAGCLPCLKPLVKSFLGSDYGRSSHGQTGASGAYTHVTGEGGERRDRGTKYEDTNSETAFNMAGRLSAGTVIEEKSIDGP